MECRHGQWLYLGVLNHGSVWWNGGAEQGWMVRVVMRGGITHSLDEERIRPRLASALTGAIQGLMGQPCEEDVLRVEAVGEAKCQAIHKRSYVSLLMTTLNGVSKEQKLE